MRKRRVTKAALARQMNTSRAQLDRLLDPENQSVTRRTVARAANILGMKGIPNNVEIWGKEWKHDWPTWRAMLPSYLERKVVG